MEYTLMPRRARRGDTPASPRTPARMSVVRFIATDGPVEVDAKIARAESILVRDFLDVFEDDETVDIEVPFEWRACITVVAVWTDFDVIHTQRATRDDVALLCRALDFANYLQSDAAVRVLATQLRGALATLPLPPAPARPRPARGPSILPSDDSFPATHDPRMRRAWRQHDWQKVEELALAGCGLAECWRLLVIGETPKKIKNLVSTLCPDAPRKEDSSWPTYEFHDALRLLLYNDAKDFFEYDARVGLSLFEIEFVSRHAATIKTPIDPLILAWLIYTSGCNLVHTVHPIVARLMCEMETPFAAWCARHAKSEEVLACIAEFIDGKNEHVIEKRLFDGNLEFSDVCRLLSLGFNAPSVHIIVDFAHTYRIEPNKPIIIALLETTYAPHPYHEGTRDGSHWFAWFDATQRRVFETRKIRDSGVDEGSAKRAIAALASL